MSTFKDTRNTTLLYARYIGYAVLLAAVVFVWLVATSVILWIVWQTASFFGGDIFMFLAWFALLAILTYTVLTHYLVETAKKLVSHLASLMTRVLHTP